MRSPSMVRVGGSSPLTRGKPIGIGKRNDSAGLIPAHAGKTAGRRDRAPAGAAHPRSRGENSVGDGSARTAAGSSPLTRGKLRAHVLPARRRGLIPAHAGKTVDTARVDTHARAHPRSRGENLDTRERGRSSPGSSPLTRGKRVDAHGRVQRAGLIPAHAGKTRGRPDSVVAEQAHPRSRGENPRWCRAGRRGGAHPRSRGENAT